MSNRPTGTAAAFATLLVLILSLVGVDLPAEAAVSIVGAIAALVSVFTPRLGDVFEITPEAIDYLHQLDAQSAADAEVAE